MRDSFLVFTTPEDLIMFMRQERKKAERYATRFILIDDWQQWDNLISKLNFEVGKVIHLSECCNGDDVFPSLQGVINSLEAMGKEESILILPLAEYLRLDWENGKDLLDQIVEWPVEKNKRIYVPLFALEEMLEQVLSNFNRYREGLLPQIWKLKGQDVSKCELVVTSFSAEKVGEGYTFIKGIKEYFSFWEKRSSSRIWLITSWAPYLCNPLQVYNFRINVFSNAYSFVQYSLKEEIKEEWGTRDQWCWLVSNMSKEENFDDLCGKILNMKSYDSKILFSRWDIYDENERWLAWIWGKLREKGGSYLHAVLQRTQKVDDFMKEAAVTIFSLSPSVELCSQRKDLLQKLRVRSMPTEFWDSYDRLEDPIAKLRVLTDISERERENVVLCTGELLKSGAKEVWKEYLKVIFPDLWKYMQGVLVEDEYITSYFRAYNQCRVKDELDEELIELLENWTEDKFWGITPRYKIVEKERENGAKIIWVDAMGMEWTGLLIYDIQEEEGIETQVKVGRAVLPSSTETNKEWKDTDEHVERELDKIAHDPNYSFPASFLKAMSFIKDVARKVKEELSVYPKVVVTSDHGLSRFALLNGNKEDLPEYFISERGGRYATGKGTNMDYRNEKEGEKFLVKDGNIVWMDYNRFKGANCSGGEIHGGAAPEECLVPVIIAYRGRREIKITAASEKVELNYRQEGWFVVEVDNPLSHLELRVGGKIFTGQRESALKWKFMIKGLEEKIYAGEVWELSRKIGDVTFIVKRRMGIEQNDLGL